MVRRLTICLTIAATLASMPVARADSYAETVRATDGLLFYVRCENADFGNPRHGPRFETIGEISTGVVSAFPGLGAAWNLTEGSHLRIPDLGEHAAVSIEMWIRLNKPATQGIAGLYAADAWQPGFVHFNLKSNGALELAVNGSRSHPNTPPETVIPGEWLHLVATCDRDEGTQALYVNGRQILEQEGLTGPRVKLVPASVGSWRNGGPTRPIEADLDEVAIYARALAPGEVRRHYHVAKGVDPTPVDFAVQIRPLLERRCFDCHGPDMQESGFRLDIRDAVHRGGESGEPGLLPYDSDRSHLVSLVTSNNRERRMPPDGPRLSDPEVALLRTWIDQGAPWPDELAGRMPMEEVTTDHWSFQPIVTSEPPAVDHPFVTTGNAVDAFLFDRLNEQRLSPSPSADRRTLIRRLFLDMHGLPPEPDEVDAFLRDETDDAWERLVDRVLASPRYGERWAAHWLDVVRYGDTHGFEVNTPRPNAWPYRDYVIKSFNDDKPYDRFIREQIAGDQIGVDAATGFLVAAPALLPGQVGKDIPSMRLARSDELHEVIVSVGSGVLGLTLGCARCHNHKFDPISQQDYYRLQAIFAGLRYGDRPIRDPGEVQFPAGNGQPAAMTVFGGTFTQPPATHRLYRGDPMQRRERVAPDVPAVFGSLELESTAEEAARRLRLADWLVSDTNPLTARVIVNRIWQHHFGTGLVATPSDFGGMGAPPSHPELLDWLAGTLIENAWSLKSIHRLILMSNTYRQSNAPRAHGQSVDADCRLLWRYPPRRLEMEAIRDAVLSVSGALDLTMGGPGFLLFKPNDNYVRVYDPKEEWGREEWRRMIYAHRVRMARDGVFGAFDCPDAGQPAPVRSRSTNAIQALNLLNSSFMKQQSELLAARVGSDPGETPDSRVRRLFELTLARAPSETELRASLDVERDIGLHAVCLALLNSNEFLWIP